MIVLLLVLSTLSAPTETDLALDALTRCASVVDDACLTAAARLKVVGEPAILPLAKRVGAMSAAGQLLALSVVGDTKSATIDAMLTKLASGATVDASVRALAIDALGKRHDKAGLQLATRLIVDPQPLVRQAAVRVLANTVTARDKALIAALTKASNDQAPTVRADAAFGLGFCGCAEAGPVLAARLADPDVGVQRAAAEGLCFVKHEPALRPLVAALESPDPLVARAAIRALQFQTEQSFGDDVGAWQRWLASRP